MRRDPAAMAGQLFDVAVIGGGMHGAWIALRAMRAGLRVALLERGDFAAATSANSLKILHGGLRYLQQLDLPRMRRSICARRAHARWFPHLFSPLPCVMPLHALGLRSPWCVGPALLLNELIGADRNAGVAAQARLPAGRMLSAAALAEEMRGLASPPAVAGALWWDGIASDAERLVIEVLREAVDGGAAVINHAQVESILHADGRVHGVAFTDCLSGRTHELHARNVVNAAGPWAAALARRSGLADAHLPVAWLGAMNLVLRRSMGNRSAVALSTSMKSTGGDAVASRSRRRGVRELFFVPWQGRTLIGTDYRPIERIEDGQQAPPPAAVQRFLEQAAALAPAARIEPADLALAHWGLLPLLRAGDAMPRKSPVVLGEASQTGAEGVMVVIGEKLTSAPQVSARVVAMLRRRLGVEAKSPPRRAQVIPSQATQPAIDAAVHARLLRHGPRWTALAEQGARHAGDLSPVRAGSPVLGVELRHAIESEMACTLHDLLRRVGAGQAGHPGMALINACATWAHRNFGWDAHALQVQVREVDAWFRSRAPGAPAPEG